MYSPARERYNCDTPHNRENRLFQLAAGGYISSPGQFKDYVREVQKLPYQNRLNLLKRIRDGIGDNVAGQLEREIFKPHGWD